MVRLLEKRKMAVVGACLLLLHFCNLAWSQVQPGSIQGTVVDRLTGRPLSGVQVTLDETLTTTDADGRFVLQNLKPSASHSLSFTRAGYVRAGLVAESDPRNITVGMTQAGNISGRITDDRGEPVEGIQVQLMRRVYDEYGSEGSQGMFSGRTNDRGEYRLYWVTPGSYYVAAELNDSKDGPQNSNAPVSSSYSLSFYPGAMDTASASRVQVTPGAELNGIDWLVRASPKSSNYAVSGRVIDSRTGQGGGAQVALTKRTAMGEHLIDGSANADGSFEFRDVAPGTYWLSAVSTEAVSGAGTRAGAEIEIIVSNRDVGGMILTMTRGATITGRVTFEGSFSSTAGRGSVGVFLRPERSPFGAPARRPQNIQPDGTFRIDSLLPGLYRLAVTSLPPEYFVREARMGPVDFLGQLVRITDATSGSLQIVVSSNSGELEGVVLDSRRQPVAGIEAILIPDRQLDRRELYLRATTDKEGHFWLRGISPGNYKVFAWENLGSYEYFDPAVVQQADPQATPVRVTESSTQSIEVRIIPDH